MLLCGPTPLLFGAEGSLGRVRVVELQQGHVEKKLITKAYQTFLMYEGWARVSLLQSHLHSKLDPTLLKTQTSTSKEVLVTTAGRQASHLYVYYIYTSWGDKGALPTVRFVKRLSMLLGQAATSLFPRTHICVNGHAVIGGIAQLLFTYLGSRDGRRGGGKKKKNREGVAIAAFASQEDKMLSEMEAMLHQPFTEKITAATWYRKGDTSVAK